MPGRRRYAFPLPGGCRDRDYFFFFFAVFLAAFFFAGIVLTPFRSIPLVTLNQHLGAQVVSHTMGRVWISDRVVKDFLDDGVPPYPTESGS